MQYQHLYEMIRRRFCQLAISTLWRNFSQFSWNMNFVDCRYTYNDIRSIIDVLIMTFNRVVFCFLHDTITPLKRLYTSALYIFKGQMIKIIRLYRTYSITKYIWTKSWRINWNDFKFSIYIYISILHNRFVDNVIVF